MDWITTWYPFQSRMVREILEHMTNAEKREYQRIAWEHGARAGRWGGWTIAVPLSFGMMLVGQSKSRLLAAAAGLLVLIGVIQFTRICKFATRQARMFLASTEWSRSQGYAEDDIRFYSFRL